MIKTNFFNTLILLRKAIKCFCPVLLCLILHSCQWSEGDGEARKFANKLHEEFDVGNCDKLYDFWKEGISTEDWAQLCSIYKSWGKTITREEMPGKWGYFDGVWKVEVKYRTVFETREFEEVIILADNANGFLIEGWTFQGLNFDDEK